MTMTTYIAATTRKIPEMPVIVDDNTDILSDVEPNASE